VNFHHHEKSQIYLKACISSKLNYFVPCPPYWGTETRAW